MVEMPQLKHTIPTFVFFSLCGFYFIVLQMALSHAPDRFLEVHKASQVPLSLSNNRLPLLDKILTPLISFFVSAFGDTSSPAYPTVVDFVWSFGAAIQIPLIEAQRIGVDGKSARSSWAIRLISHPMVWGILYQRLSGGWIIPLWLLAFMHSKTRADGMGIERAKAESVLAGWWFGHSIPALIMLIPGQPKFKKAPIWVAFPILMSVAQESYLFVRRWATRQFKGAAESGKIQSGYAPLQLTYLSAFVGSCIAHFHLVIVPGLTAAPATSPTPFVLLNKFVGLAQHLWTFFVPATGLAIPKPSETTAASGVVHFVQFDIIVVFAAVWTAGLWDLALRRHHSNSTSEPETPIKSTLRWALEVLSVLICTSLILGPGAATAALYAYREVQLESARRAAQVIAASEEDDEAASVRKDVKAL
jgi:hypothetical protein